MTDRTTELVLVALAVVFGVVGYSDTLLAPTGYEPGPRPPGGLRVVTWNVGAATDEGGRPLRDEWIPDIAGTLNALDPDLVFLQEVGSADQRERLVAELGPGWQAAAHPARQRDVVALWQRGELTVLTGRRDPGPGALIVRFRPHGRRAVTAVGLHAHPFSPGKRNRLIGRCAHLLEHAWSSGGRILAGDLNLDLDLDKRRDLFSNNTHLDVESYNYVASRFFDAAVGRGTTAEPDRRLDYIFADDKFAVIDAGPVKNQRVAPMDHDPVVADLEYVEP